MLSIPKYPEQYAQHFRTIFYLPCCASQHHVSGQAVACLGHCVCRGVGSVVLPPCVQPCRLSPAALPLTVSLRTRCGRWRRPHPRRRATPSGQWQQCWPPVYHRHRHFRHISSLSSSLSACTCTWQKCLEERGPARPEAAQNVAPMAGTVEAASAASSANSRSPPPHWRPPMGPPRHPCCVRAATGRAGRPPARGPGPAATAPPGSGAGWRLFRRPPRRAVHPSPWATPRASPLCSPVRCRPTSSVLGARRERCRSRCPQCAARWLRWVSLWQACCRWAWLWRPGVPPLRLPAQAFTRAGPGRCGMGVRAHWTSPGMHGQ